MVPSLTAHSPVTPCCDTAGIGQSEGRPLDLVITNTSEYTPKQSSHNGLAYQSAAAFVQINLLNDRRTDLRFCFVDSSTSEIVPVEQARSGRSGRPPGCEQEEMGGGVDRMAERVSKNSCMGDKGARGEVKRRRGV